jgi:hypothetical protein
VHSDDFYGLYFRPYGEPIPPTSDYFFSYADLDSLIDNPADLDDNGEEPPVYNTVCEQGTYNGRREHLLLATPDVTTPYLHRYAVYGSAVIEDHITGDFAQPLLDAAERAAFLADIDAKILAYGDGNWTAGHNYVVEQQNRFSTAQHPDLTTPPGENTPPQLDWQPAHYVPPGETVSFSLAASDDDGDELAYSLISAPPRASLVGADFTWSPSLASPGIYEVRFSTTDGRGGMAIRSAYISVDAAAIPALPRLSMAALASLLAATAAARLLRIRERRFSP